MAVIELRKVSQLADILVEDNWPAAALVFEIGQKGSVHLTNIETAKNLQVDNEDFIHVITLLSSLSIINVLEEEKIVALTSFGINLHNVLNDLAQNQE